MSMDWSGMLKSEHVRSAPVVVTHLLCLFAPFVFNKAALLVACGLALITGLGITLSFHRNLTHHSFKLPKWLEYLFAYFGLHALQRDPIFWVSVHRYHHQHVDSKGDPHSPIEGFWFSHIGWLFAKEKFAEKCGKFGNVGDLQKQPYYRFLHTTYLIHPIALGVLLFVLGGFPYIVWGMGVRVVVIFHMTFIVGSACHTWGTQAWNTGDRSKNNWWVALFSIGEGWHNNHHAFEHSARHGLEWWQIDPTWCIIRFLEAIGLATHVMLPTPAQKQRMAIKSDVS